jgi:hypothetical protein
VDKRVDRMPKEYKIAIYALILGTVYFFLYSLIFFGKFHYKPFFIGSMSIVLIYGVFIFLLVIKSNFARIFLAAISIVQAILFTLVMFSLIFFKQSTAFLSKTLHLGIFTFYLLLGQIGTTPGKGVFAALIVAGWSLFVSVLLMNKETARYTREKTYELVNTHKETSLSLVFLILIIAALYFLVRF